MASAGHRLHPAVLLEVTVDDRSTFGSPLTGRPDQSTRDVFETVLRHVDAHGPATLTTDGPRLLAEVVAGPAFAEIADVAPDGSWTLHDDVLFPDPDLVSFTGLSITGPDGRVLEVGVPAEDWPTVHVLFAALAGPGGFTLDQLAAAGGSESAEAHARALFDALLQAGWVEPTDIDEVATPALAGSGLLFAGHNLVVIATDDHRVAIDPFLRPSVPADESGYRALTWRELGPIDAVLITHSHPDHFAPGSLLQIDPDTTIVVPRIERETILSVDMARRLRELGFRHIVELGWHESHDVGPIRIDALPFLGEQPTDGATLHPDIRNAGNTYLVRTASLSVALLADSGRDHLGSAADLAADARARFGPVDAVFCGYRGWRTYPAQLLFSSVARYLLFVPRDRWDSRMCLMNDLDDVVDVAERWGASMLVPYADGGAPWFWEIGLGPRLDEHARELEGFDPFPERVIDAARQRVRAPSGGYLSSPVEVRLLRPNDALVGWPTPELVRDPANSWPYPERASPT
jgi:L-ascorbate metabolism protein UlaG (beta-lactamase superfamily)